MSYFYLVASLPTLELDGAAPLSVEAFCFQCEGVLSAKDLSDLRLVLEPNAVHESSCGLVARWRQLDIQIRNTIARFRANQLGLDPRAHMQNHSGFNGLIEKGISEAFSRQNPLEKEDLIDKCRWALLDELELEEPFGFGVVLAFGLKLQLLARRSLRNENLGRQRFSSLISSALEKEDCVTEMSIKVD